MINELFELEALSFEDDDLDFKAVDLFDNLNGAIEINICPNTKSCSSTSNSKC